MIKNSTVQRNIIGVLDQDELVNIIGETKRFLDYGYKLNSALKSNFDGDIDAKEDEELSLIDSIAALPQALSTNDMRLNSCFRDFGSQYRCIEFLISIDRVMALCKSYSEAYIPLSNPERIELSKELETMLSHGANFLYYQFSMDEFIEDKINDNELRINIELAMFCESRKIKYTKFVAYIHNLVGKYRTTLPIFIEYPELEEEFIKAVGPFYSDFAQYENLLTVDIITELSRDNISAEEVLAGFKIRCEQDPSLLKEVDE